MTGRAARLLIIGDSIVLGVTNIVGNEVRETTPRGFVQQLRERLSGWRIDVDAAVRRNTSRALDILQPLLEKHRPQYVLYCLGGSDADINWKQFILTDGERIRHLTPAGRFERNLHRLAEQTRQAGACPIFVSLPEQDLLERGRQLSEQTGRDVLAMIEKRGGQAESDRRQALYANVIEKVSAQTTSPLAQWTDRVRELPFDQRFSTDAIHPSAAAHDLIAEVVSDLLIRQAACGAAVPLASIKS